MQFINLTPHSINVYLNGQWNEYPASGQLARCAQETEQRGEINGIPVELNTFGAVEGLPQPQEGIAYIVSSLVLSRVPERADVFAPANPIRDDNGQIIGCAGLSCTPAYRPPSTPYWQIITGYSSRDKIIGYIWGEINSRNFHWNSPPSGEFMGIIVGDHEALQSGIFQEVSDVWHRPYEYKNGKWESLPLNYGYYGYGDDWVEPMTPYQEDKQGYIIPKMFEV